ncbi:MAG: hypothetical protein HKN11_11540 [Rhizobiales bacterium]|nr:hypothetical protein [Hyphomicrobiales bacterium]
MSVKRTFHGTCHCGALKVDYESAKDPAKTTVRECQCSFCRLHAAKAVSDPDGTLRFTEQTAGALNRYVFGLRTAEFLTCHTCGAYMGCILTDGDAAWGIVNIRTLADGATFTAPPTAADYDAETTAARITRRKAMWTPAEILPAS